MRMKGLYSVFDTANGETLVENATAAEAAEILEISESRFRAFIKEPKAGLDIQKTGEVPVDFSERKTKHGWKSPEEYLPKKTEPVLVVVSGKYKNVEFVSAVMLASYDDDDDGGWILEEYPEWENPYIEFWMEIPRLPLEVRKNIREVFGGKRK